MKNSLLKNLLKDIQMHIRIIREFVFWSKQGVTRMNVTHMNKYIDNQENNEIYYGCKTTGMVCKNDCHSNCNYCSSLVKFATIQEAFDEGYKPCIRCQPDHEKWDGAKQKIIICAKIEIEKSYRDKFSLKNLADKVYTNEDYLGRIFKEVVGETPLKYHHYVRCEHGRELLGAQNNSVDIVAYKVGYQSTSHFIKVFKSIYGETPLQYRKKEAI